MMTNQYHRPAARNNVVSITPLRKRKYHVAFAITITKDGFFQDGAAVLAYSTMKVSRDRNYEVSFIAFVHPNVTKARPLLRKVGYQLRKFFFNALIYNIVVLRTNIIFIA